jgi:transcriptional regulator GlxA family with amidase domain
MHDKTGMLSKSVNLSPMRLRQLFKKETGRSPMQYLRGLRMQHAEHLLGTTFLTVKEVAFVTGVQHVSSFVHAFKARSGITPGEFRARKVSSFKSYLNRARSDAE